MTQVHDRLLDHDYDGIRELDNDLPTWWVWMFYVTIIFSVGYLLYFHVFQIGYSSDDEYRVEMDPRYVRVQAADTKLLGVLETYHSPYFNPHGDVTPWSAAMSEGLLSLAPLTRETDTTTWALLTDDVALQSGRAVFVKNCASCHGPLGEGGVGPNLTDDYWLHGADGTSLVKSIQYGNPPKGMIAWRGFLQPDQIVQAASFVASIRGSAPPNGKAPEGELVAD